VPAAAVIPAPIAYIKIVAVKKLVVGFLVWRTWPASVTRLSAGVRLPSFWGTALPFTGWESVSRSFTLKKLECLKQACAMNTLAWNNNLGLWSYFVGF
jgi:hypothetical protein